MLKRNPYSLFLLLTALLLSAYIFSQMFFSADKAYTQYLTELKTNIEKGKSENCFFELEDGQWTKWGRQDIALSPILEQLTVGEHITKLKQGYFYVWKKQSDPQQFFIIPITYEFITQNEYTQDYNPSNTNFKLSSNSDRQVFELHDEALKISAVSHFPNAAAFALIICLSLFVILSCQKLKNKGPSIIIWLTYSGLCWLLTSQLAHLAIADTQSVLSPALYAHSNFIPSLSTLWVVALAPIGTLYLLKEKLNATAVAVCASLLIFGAIYFFQSLVINSPITESTWVVFPLTGQVSYLLTFLGLIFTAAFAYSLIRYEKVKIEKFIPFLFIISALFYFFSLPWFMIATGILFVLAKKPPFPKGKLIINNILAVLIFGSGLFYLHKVVVKNKVEAHAKLLAERMINDEDFLLNVALYDVIDQIPEHHEFENAEQAKLYLIQQLPSEYIFNYELSVGETKANTGFSLNFAGYNFKFTRKYYPFGLGFPTLFKNVSSEKNQSNIAFAMYHQGSLSEAHGSYEYPQFMPNSWENKKGWSHKTSNHSGDRIAVISTLNIGLQQQLSSWLFFLFLIGLFLQVFEYRIKLFERSLKRKLQITFIVMAALAVISITGIATSTLINQSQNRNISVLKERIHSVQIELNHKLRKDDYLSIHNTQYLQEILQKFSAVFFTDITLYGKEGRLLATSRNELYEKGFLSNLINPNVLNQIQNNSKSVVIKDEAIGRLKYLSAYLPFKTDNGEILAYINLPYFARQAELENEVAKFTGSLFSTVLLVFVIVLIVSLVFATQINRPLKQLGQKLNEMSLTGVNQQINIKSDKELDYLIDAYNKKVEELQKMVAELSQKERESAWKEMAKQVAHEIKNPLTPIKLQAQLLQLKMKKEGISIVEETESFLKTLIQQVDVLSKIANEFSQFAKLPKANAEIFDPQPIIEQCLEFFLSKEEYQFTYPEENIQLKMDVSHFNRILNNVVKNAIQAMENSDEIALICQVSTQENNLLIAITDKGEGISENIQHQIFEPKFTTKSKGMGLGLSMVKNMVTQAGGNIWFESEQQKGTTFFIQFPHL